MAHNLVYFDSSTNSIQQFSNAQLDDLAERVLRVMAAGTYTGTITIGTTASIGTFADTALVDVAGGTNTTTVTNTYTLSQVGTATLGATSDPPMHVGLSTSTPNQTILQENLTTKEQLADEIIARMVASTGGTNAYYLATSAPADGATWVSRGSLLDEITNLTVVVSDYKLWHRTTSGAVLTNRDPVKLSSGNIQSFSTAEINALIKTIEERIIATGIGTYVLQASAPGTGTWTNVGTVTDTRENIDTSNFTGVASYTNEDATAYTSTYQGTISYTGDDATAYAGTYVGTRSFINPDGANFQATYLGPVTYTTPISFVNPNGAAFVNVNAFSFLGPSYALSYTGGFQGVYNTTGLNFSPGAVYTGGPFSFSPGVIPTPQGVAPTFFGTRNFTPSYTGARDFLGPTFSSDFNPGATFAPNYLGPATYLGPTVRPSFSSFTNVDSPAAAFSPIAYAGPTGPFVSAFTNFESTYLGPATFISPLTDFTGPNYAGPQSYEGAAAYEGTRVGSTTSTISTRTLWRRVA